MRDQRDQLLKLLDALNASTRTLRRDACGDWSIQGKDGKIYGDGRGFLLVVSTNESARRWGFVKKRLAFAELRQDGDDEGALHLDRLPSPAEAELIRDALGIRKRKTLSADTLAGLRARLPSAEKRHITAKDASARDPGMVTPAQCPECDGAYGKHKWNCTLAEAA
jgi:hypothetical protein